MSQVLNLANLQLAMAQNNSKMKEWVTSQIGNISIFEIKWVEELPTENISATTIYMVPLEEGSDENNAYAEYVYKEGTGWEKLGTLEAGSINLEDYYTSVQIDEMLANLNITVENYTDEEISGMIDGIWGE